MDAIIQEMLPPAMLIHPLSRVLSLIQVNAGPGLAYMSLDAHTAVTKGLSFVLLNGRIVIVVAIDLRSVIQDILLTAISIPPLLRVLPLVQPKFFPDLAHQSTIAGVVVTKSLTLTPMNGGLVTMDAIIQEMLPPAMLIHPLSRVLSLIQVNAGPGLAYMSLDAHTAVTKRWSLVLLNGRIVIIVAMGYLRAVIKEILLTATSIPPLLRMLPLIQVNNIQRLTQIHVFSFVTNWLVPT